MQLVTIVKDRSVARSLDNLITLMSPQGASAFLGGVIGPYLAKRGQVRFRQEGDDVTGAWAPLKQATVTIRQSQGFGAGPINRRTGELENWVVGSGWFAYQAGYGAAMRFPRNEPSGELRKKVETAQRGRQSPNTVARPVLGVNERDLIFLQTSLMFAVEEAIV